MAQAKEFFYQDKTGRDYTNTFNLTMVRQCFPKEKSYNGIAVSTWALRAEVGDVWENAANRITRTK